MNRTRPLSAARVPRRQRGVVLMVALIVLVALTLAGLSMVRSADTGTIVAGNLAFRQAATQTLDAGLEAAVAGMPQGYAASDLGVANKYYKYMLPDANGDGLPDLPVGQTWAGVGNPSGAYVINNPANLNGYTVRYVVERMCFQGAGAAITTDLEAEARCNLEPKVSGADSGKIAGQEALGQDRKTHYRITAKVEGPRNTETFAQAVVAK
jgi:type IV pilus assembly protein PilX